MFFVGIDIAKRRHEACIVNQHGKQTGKSLSFSQLSRFRFSLVDSISDLKRRVIGLLDVIFPEYETLFSDLFGKTSSELLLEFTTPEEMVAVDTEKLAALITQHSRNRLGREKAEQIQSAAGSSFGIDYALDAYRFQLRLLLEHIRFAEQPTFRT